MSGKDIRKKNSSFMAHYMPFWAVMGVKCAYINELADILLKQLVSLVAMEYNQTINFYGNQYLLKILEFCRLKKGYLCIDQF